MMRVLSLGAGVQSTTLALMAAHGEVEVPDCAIFADTQSEPAHVYKHLEWLMSPGVLLFPVHIVTAGSLRNRIYESMLSDRKPGQSRISSGQPPFFTESKLGSGGMLWRECTATFKIEPLRREIRRLAGLTPRARGPKTPIVEQWLGISRDEAHRMRTSDLSWITFRYPLIEKGMTRQECLLWLDRHGYARPKKSACTFCPYHSDAEWNDFRQNDRVAWDEVNEIDKLIRDGDTYHPRGRRWFLHRSRRPLDEVLLTDLDKGQPDLFGNECEGMCGV